MAQSRHGSSPLLSPDVQIELEAYGSRGMSHHSSDPAITSSNSPPAKVQSPALRLPGHDSSRQPHTQRRQQQLEQLEPKQNPQTVAQQSWLSGQCQQQQQQQQQQQHGHEDGRENLCHPQSLSPPSPLMLEDFVRLSTSRLYGESPDLELRLKPTRENDTMAREDANASNQGRVSGRTRKAVRETTSRLDAAREAVSTKLDLAYQKIVIEGILRQKPLSPSQDGRHVPLDAARAPEDHLVDERRKGPYTSNFIRSTRYTLFSFLPKQLYFQFSKLGNFYFLVMGCLQLVPGYSTTGKGTILGPLVVFVLLSMGKEGYDDYKRYQMDKTENRSTAWVLATPATGGRNAKTRWSWPWSRGSSEVGGRDAGFDGDWVPMQWQQVEVGDVVRLRRNDSVPADMVLLHATGPNHIAYVDTMALDGETNLKSKETPARLAARCGTVEEIRACRAEVVSEDPNMDLYSYEGRVAVGGETLPLSTSNVVFRGSTLRNTKQAIGLVVNTGEECKIRMNAHRDVRAKFPAMQRTVNRLILFLILVLLSLGFGLTGGHYLVDPARNEAFYLSNVSFDQLLFGYLITFYPLIPISLYISLEIVKLFQLYFLADVEMYDARTDTPMVANTGTILEDLGQINYLFSDKTGTLTENIMRFRNMSVAGAAFLCPDIDPSVSSKTSEKVPQETAPDPGPKKTEQLIDYVRRNPDTEFSKRARHFILCIALCHTCLPETGDDGSIGYQASSPDEVALVEAARDLGLVVVDRPASSIKIQLTGADGSTKTTETYQVLDVIEFSSERKCMSVIVRMPDERICLISKGADSAIVPRLRQADLAQEKARLAQQQASSRRRTMEMDRSRSRQSTEPQQGEGRVRSFLRGGRSGGEQNLGSHRSAESESRLWQHDELAAAFSQDHAGQQQASLVDEGVAGDDAAVFEKSFRHMDEFSSEGLRTLVYGYAYLDEHQYDRWKREYQEATTSLANRQERIGEVAEKIEGNLELAGVTAIEDKLQAGVPDTIDKLRRAGIRIWVLTGDKRETAINISHSARVCRPDSELHILDSTKEEGLRGQLTSALAATQRGGDVPHSVLVVDGKTLGHIEDNSDDFGGHEGKDAGEPGKDTGEPRPSLGALFYELIAAVDSVICCRASPLQKAALVSHVKQRVPNSMTLAIGDGSNDIGMIQASHVGVGISGREGLQAARIADFSIAQFRFLQRLLLVHGRWNYGRTGKYILATFWKEVLFYLVQAHYQRSTLYSGTSLYESNTLMVFNVLFTSIPVIFMGIVHRDLEAETLLEHPELYASFGPRRRGFSLHKYLGWTVMGVVHSVILYWLFWGLYRSAGFDNDNSIYAEGLAVFTTAVVLINVKILLFEVHNKNVLIFLGLCASVVGWWVWNLAISKLYPDDYNEYLVRDTLIRDFGRQLFWWVAVALILAAVLSVELAAQALRRAFWPTDVDFMQRAEREVRVSRRGRGGRREGPAGRGMNNGASA